MEFKGTKGEWSIEESFDDMYNQKIFNISTDSMEGLAVIYTGGELFKDEQQANAKLISSAPDLLEALKHGLRLAETLPNKESIAVKQFVKNATKAIEKALL